MSNYHIMKSLILVESPAKCNKILSFLDNNYLCEATYGHLREIKTLKNINDKYEIEFTIMDSKKKQIDKIKKKLKQVDEVILATDDDREGEGIAWHVTEIFNLPVTTKRIKFNSITKDAILSALNNPLQLDMNMVHAQQGRQILDLLVGFKISPILWNDISRTSNLSAGRCQTPALNILYDNHQKIKKAFIGSGIRYDLLVDDFNKNNQDNNHEEYIEQLITRHISGRLKVAPEHTSDATLKLMRKPSFKYFHKFKETYDRISEKHGMNQPLIPYFISSHPGCDNEDMANLATETKEMGFQLEQVQDFTPTPMTVATVIYYSGVHPYTLKPHKTVKDKEEKLNQRRFFFWYKRENHSFIKQSLNKANRPDLIEKLIGTKKTEPRQIPKWLEKKRNSQR